MQAYEKLGFFYLGKDSHSTAEGAEIEPLLFPSAALRTHALCVGMTGSGKTGLGIDILEEAAIDGIPALVIDPKGDMSNLCLSFPEMRPEDFAPWLDDEEMRIKKTNREEYSVQLAEKWRNGLAKWGQDPERIKLLREGADITVYTPGSQAGEPISLLDTLDAPGEQLLQDFNSLNELVSNTASALLKLLGIEADPLQSRETILLSNILQTAWHRGENLDLASIIGYIQNPPSASVGVLDWDSFYPPTERRELALRFNSLLASPGFNKFLQGRPLDIDSLLYNKDAKAKISILSIAHLSEDERMFFVSMFFNRLLAWVRTQSGSESLRALLYMDEIYGYFPPVANPPSKRPLLTLLKQARAYGLGIVLCTQNPMDLDYKGLSNIGTWWIGRLQTDNDRNRLLAGLKAANDAQGNALSQAELEKVISSLEPRQFLLHNVRSNALSLFDTRHCLAYLKGPMTLADIKALKEQGLYVADDYISVAAERSHTEFSIAQQNLDPNLARDLNMPIDVGAAEAHAQQVAAKASAQALQGELSSAQGFGTVAKPAFHLNIPEDVSVYYTEAPAGSTYYPRLAALTETYFVDKANRETATVKEFRMVDFTDGPVPINWEDSEVSELSLADLRSEASPNCDLDTLPEVVQDKKNYRQWEKDLIDYLYRNLTLTRYENEYYKLRSLDGETERDFLIRLQKESREERENEISKLRSKFEKQLERQAEKVRRAEQRVDQKEEMQEDAKRQTMITVGSSILNAVLGKNPFGTGTLGRATTAGRTASRSGRLKSDVSRAEETLETYREDYARMEEEMSAELDELADKLESQVEDVKEIQLTPLKRDVKVQLLFILWQA